MGLSDHPLTPSRFRTSDMANTVTVLHAEPEKVSSFFFSFLKILENEDAALYPCPESAVDLAMALAQKCQLNSIRLLDVDGNEVKVIGEPEVSGGFLGFPSRDGSSLCAFLIRVLRLLLQMSPGASAVLGCGVVTSIGTTQSLKHCFFHRSHHSP
ncbi:hypothetical protein RHSIM_Rhsim01G0267900 [Rhododendron simsii]|uniref:Uncharacterized protein n=1 Tax=Rhododendron simsii TaxID=118357 RepID=A0A834HIC1_RHOSS|nr:hypothetical protein RHSIM_Rhsim01G0267900 [Rhododendron simsii]